MTDILIVGAGPAGLTAAVYACRAGMQVTVFDKNLYGGQAAITKDIENFPAIDNINGADFSHRLYKQAIKVGADIRFEEVRSVKLTDSIKTVQTSVGSYQARTVILAHGVRRRHLDCPGEMDFSAKGFRTARHATDLFTETEMWQLSAGEIRRWRMLCFW